MNCTSSSARGRWPEVAAAPTAIKVGMVAADAGEEVGVGGGGDVEGGGAVIALKMSTTLNSETLSAHSMSNPSALITSHSCPPWISCIPLAHATLPEINANNNHATYFGLQRKSQGPDSAAMWRSK